LRPAAEAERAVGIEWYVTDGAPCEGRVKSEAEDFRVEEQVDLGEIADAERPGYYPLYRVEKRSVGTMHMAEELSEALKSRVAYGGLKDKRSQSVQYVTPTSLRGLRPAEVVRERFTAKLVGYVPSPLARAGVVGNLFDVVIRGCCDGVGERIEEAIRFAKEARLPNFYGMQRFGTSGAGTHRIGKALVAKRFEEAVRLMLFERSPSDDEAILAARELLAKGRFEEGAGLLPPGKDVERMVARELGRHPGEWVKALRSVPVKLRRLYVQAYQSMIFNETMSLVVGKGEDISKMKPGDNWAATSHGGLMTARPMGVRDPATDDAVPMVQMAGYAFRDYGSRFDACLKKAMEEEGVAAKDFFVEEMQEVSVEGGFRRPHLAVGDATWSVEGKTATLKFTLGKGEYATVLLREVLKPRDPAASGLG
jgi:tRNA pseudouridine13 synthase